MKLIYLHINSYKIFRDFDLDFCAGLSPADIVVIAGVNGTGKTTLLREVLSGDNLSHEPDEDLGFLNCMNADDMLIQYPIYKNAYPREIVYFATLQNDLANLTSFVTRYVDKVVFEEGRTSFDAYKEIQQLIDSIFKDFQLGTRFYGMNRDRELVFENARGVQFGIDGLSGGEKQILNKVLPLFTNEMNGKIILMDEPEESLHPAWQSSLIPVLRRCAKENDCQFILATHSPQLISSVRAEELRMLVRTKDGNIDVVTCEEGPYGWTVEKVLSEIQKVNHFRVPEVEEKLAQLNDMIERNEYSSDSFNTLWKEMEDILGYSDRDLILMRMEILRKKKKG